MEHLLNCHGEWAALLAAVPALGTAISYFRGRFSAWRQGRPSREAGDPT